VKPISLFIILVLVLLPVICFTHPTELHAEVSADIFDIITSECPDKQGMDNCEFSCCCAEYTPSDYRNINNFSAMRLSGQSPYAEPPHVFIPIFVPPQNISWSIHLYWFRVWFAAFKRLVSRVLILQLVNTRFWWLIVVISCWTLSKYQKQFQELHDT
jgi:hypothetical protein